MSSTCFASLQLNAIRVAQLTTAGSPVNGAGHGYVTDAAIKLDVAVELEQGTELTQKNGSGALCAVFKTADRIKRLNLAMDLCQLDSSLLAMLTGADTFVDSGNAIGFQYPSVSGEEVGGVCIEAWSKAWDGAEQAVPDFTDPNAAFFHWVFPRTKWVQGSITIEEGIMVIPVTGTGEENTQITANGPFDDWPQAIANAGGVTRVGGVFLDDEIPTATCGPISVTSAAS